MKICRKLLPITALTFCAISMSVWVISLPALAEQEETPAEKATEAMLLEQLTAHRNWRAQAAIYLAQFQADEAKLATAQKQLDGQQKQIADLQRQVAEAKGDAAAAKAIPPAETHVTPGAALGKEEVK